ncbi:MAG: M48 family metallopeptidase, partial [Verrucomicrobiota bacterium]
AGTLAVVGLASLYKWNEFSGGGSAVAESVGARRVEPNTSDLRERQLLNVTEEMAIAAGLPAPAVYVLDDEPGINAFAAGLTTSDAVVTVTRGTLDKLTRDELQGVIGHEFSHILNGDMRLNLRLTAIIFGILVIGLAGRGVLWALSRGRISSRNSKNSGGIIIAAGAIGVALLALGYVGYFFGRLIQAAVSRQREFLADASAVQFTRNPGGITGALKKIGGYALGSTVIAHNTSQISHFFFAQGFRSNFGGAWATHPPLDERIRAVDPQFDGKMFDPPELVDVEHENFLEAGFAPTLPSRFGPLKPPPRRVAIRPAALVAEFGTLTAEHFNNAQKLLEAIPSSLREAARDPARAPALVYALLLADDPALRETQLALVAQHAAREIATSTARLSALDSGLSALSAEARLPLLQLTLPALRTLDPAALNGFLKALDELVRADGEVTPFEFALQKMLAHQLALASAPRTRIDYYSFDALTTDIAVVLSTLARVGARAENAAAAAFTTGAAQLRMIEGRLALLAVDACTLDALNAALDKLAAATPVIKQRLLVAAAQVIAADGTITVEEGELYRAIAATLDVPMPPPDAA